MAAILDNRADLILSYKVTDNKPKYDAAGLAEAAIRLTGRVPDLRISDKLNGYKRGFVNAIQGRNPLAIMIADAATNGVHLEASIFGSAGVSGTVGRPLVVNEL